MLSLPFLAWTAGAAAQDSRASLVATAEPSLRVVPERAGLPDFRMPRGDLREAGAPRRNGLIAALPVGGRVSIGVGRFAVPELVRLRTHVEPQHRAADVRRRDRGIAAVGVSFSF